MGNTLPLNQCQEKENDAMYVTYQDLIQIEILIVALANLICPQKVRKKLMVMQLMRIEACIVQDSVLLVYI